MQQIFVALHILPASGQGLKSVNNALRHSRYSIPDGGFEMRRGESQTRPYGVTILFSAQVQSFGHIQVALVIALSQIFEQSSA